MTTWNKSSKNTLFLSWLLPNRRAGTRGNSTGCLSCWWRARWAERVARSGTLGMCMFMCMNDRMPRICVYVINSVSECFRFQAAVVTRADLCRAERAAITQRPLSLNPPLSLSLSVCCMCFREGWPSSSGECLNCCTGCWLTWSPNSPRCIRMSGSALEGTELTYIITVK